MPARARTLLRLLPIVALTALLATGQVARSDTPTLASISIDTAHPGLTISPTFMGFSHEWSVAQQLMGSSTATSGANPIYRQLIQNLLASGGGPFVLRVGGNSTDETTKPKPGAMEPFAQLASDLGATFILGVNLGADNRSLAIDQAQADIRGMPDGSLQAIEIGNEPDLYHDNGHRPPGYTYADYTSEFADWRAAIEPLLPRGAGLMGPSWSSATTLKNLPDFLDREAPYLTLVSHHWYAGTQCNGKTNPSDYLLRPQAATSGAAAVQGSVPVAHQRGLPFRIGEMNSVSCGGETGVSDVFASALWALDSMFELAHVGVDGVNIHTGNGGGYALFSFATDTSSGTPTYTLTSVRPEYYGLLLFERAAPAGSQLLPVAMSSTANVKAWATRDASGDLRVIVINKDESATGDVVIQTNLDTPEPASLIRLQAPALNARTGITLGGQTFDGSPDGTLQGDLVVEQVDPQSGTCTFSLPPVSAALLRLTAAGAHA
jgi:hypothetical protein